VVVEQNTEELVYPANLIYNHHNRRQEPCLVILFATLLIGGLVYPLTFEFWISKFWFENGTLYLTKNDIAEEVYQKLITSGLKFDSIFFDAGFCNKDMISAVNLSGKKVFTRFPKSWKILENGESKTVKEALEALYNGKFYYDIKLKTFLYPVFGVLNGVEVQLVASANTKTKLLNRDFYIVLTNDTELMYTQVMRKYLLRGKIEHFFKNLKSYFGLTSLNTRYEDSIAEKIGMLLFAYCICLEFSKNLKKSIYRTLQFIKSKSKEYLEEILAPFIVKFTPAFVNVAFQEK
jgi:hypothetical protein